MKIIEMNKRGRYSHTLFGHKVVRLLLAASLQCGLFVPYVFGDNNLHINIMNQDGVVSGLVRDATGMPLIGVSVVVKGTMQGVVTDMDGKFSLEVPRGSVLVFSYIGMQSVEMSVTDQKDLNIVMKENSEAIDEIVVVGYGTVKKSNLSGAVSSVSSKDLQKLPAANLSQALQGNAPGLYSLQSSRDPGASVSLSIRGKNSFSGGDPLFIVDGFPMHLKGSTGLQLKLQGAVQLILESDMVIYLKKLMKFVNENNINKNKLEVTPYMELSAKENIKLYDIFIQKLTTGIYSKRPANPVEKLINARDIFIELTVKEQCIVLSEILHLFQCKPLTSANLVSINLKKTVGIIQIAKNITAKNVKLVHQSPTGIYEYTVDLNKI